MRFLFHIVEGLALPWERRIPPDNCSGTDTKGAAYHGWKDRINPKKIFTCDPEGNYLPIGTECPGTLTYDPHRKICTGYMVSVAIRNRR